MQINIKLHVTKGGKTLIGVNDKCIPVYGLLSGNYISQTRNKKIAAIFKEAQLIEKYESGIKRIEDEFVKYGLQTPLFENFQHGFRVTIYSKSSGKLEALLIEDPRATIPELANRLNITTRAH